MTRKGKNGERYKIGAEKEEVTEIQRLRVFLFKGSVVLLPAILPLLGTALRVLSLLISTTQKALGGTVGPSCWSFVLHASLTEDTMPTPFELSIYCASLAQLSTLVSFLKTSR